MDTQSGATVDSLAASFDCLTPQEVKRLAGVTDSTLEAWRKRGKGPEYIVFGNQILYPRAGLAKYLESKVRERRALGGKAML